MWSSSLARAMSRSRRRGSPGASVERVVIAVPLQRALQRAGVGGGHPQQHHMPPAACAHGGYGKPQKLHIAVLHRLGYGRGGVVGGVHRHQQSRSVGRIRENRLQLFGSREVAGKKFRHYAVITVQSLSKFEFSEYFCSRKPWRAALRRARCRLLTTKLGIF